MKKIKIFLFLVLLAGSVTVSAQNAQNHGKHRPPRRPPTCQTPLDGGLLSIRGVAGIFYYLGRKKGNKKES
jgi:hypothetical protein